VPDTSELPDLPSGWCWATTQLVGEVLLGRQRAPQYLTGRWPRHYLRVANIKDDRIDFSDVESMDFDEIHFDKYRLLAGDILVSEGQSPELVGQSAIFRRYHQPLCFQKTLHRFRSLPGVVLPEFAQLVFRTHVYTGVFRAVASITTNIAHLTLEKFEVVRFPLPPLAEQIEIVAAADLRLSAVKAMERSLTTCFQQSNAQRQNILRAAFSGQLVPQDPNDEPASVLLERIRAEREARGAMNKPRGRKAKELA
jgi:type I restriction enzyme S subunit